jgi:hypothetical protein
MHHTTDHTEGRTLNTSADADIRLICVRGDCDLIATRLGEAADGYIPVAVAGPGGIIWAGGYDHRWADHILEEDVDLGIDPVLGTGLTAAVRASMARHPSRSSQTAETVTGRETTPHLRLIVSR